MQSFVRYLLVSFALFLVFSLSGCGIAGSPDRPTEDDSVTLIAKVDAPEVNSSAIMASSQFSSDDVLNAIAADGSCQVNNRAVEFSFDKTSSTLTIEKMPPADAYELMLKIGSLELRAVQPYSSRRIVFPSGISMQTTAEWHIRNAYAREASLSIGSFAQYGVLAAEVNSLAGAMINELKKSDASANSITTLVNGTLNGLMARKQFTEVFAFGSKAFDFNGDWKGSVYYYLHNAAGTPALAVQANAEMTISCSGNAVSGSMSLTPLGVVPLLSDVSGISQPSDLAFSFHGTCSNSFLRFTRTGNLGPLAGKPLDEWEVFVVNGGIAFRVKNVDSAYNTGLKSMPGDFILSRDDS